MTKIRTDTLPSDMDRSIGAGFDPKAARVGQGLTGSGEIMPSVSSTPPMDRAMASLDGFLSGSVNANIDVLLVQVAVAMRDTEAGNQKTKINTDQATKKAQLKEKEAKLEEAQRKLDEAEAKKNSGSLIDKIKLAFEWLGAILALAVAAALIATGAGAVVGGLLVAAAVTSLVMAVDSTVNTATGHGIAGAIAIEAGASEEEAAKADTGFKVSLAVLGVSFSIASGGAGIAGASRAAISAGVKAADAASTAGETGLMALREVANAAKTAFSNSLQTSSGAISQTSKIASRSASITEASMATGTTLVDVGRSAVQYQETGLRADAKRLEGQAKQDQAVIQTLDDMIDQALTRLMDASERFNQILDDITDAMSDRANTLSRVRFSG